LLCIEKAVKHEYQLILSSFILEETKRNLLLKFGLSTRDVEIFIEELMQVATLINPTPFLKIIKTKETDNRILEVALSSEADYLITGDKKDILILRHIGKVKIVTPAQFLDLLE